MNRAHAEHTAGAVSIASAATPEPIAEQREALAPQQPASEHGSAASDRMPTSGTAAGDAAAHAEMPGVASAGEATARPHADGDAEAANDGSPSATCINGWMTPRPGSKLRKTALDMIRGRRGERFVVLEMRYFVGPEDAEVIGPPREVERWYVKARSLGRHARHQRWLLRRAEVGSGVDAVAPFDSTGHGPGTWIRPDAIDESTADPFERPCDRVRPGAPCVGLPREVLGCLQGT